MQILDGWTRGRSDQSEIAECSPCNEILACAGLGSDFIGRCSVVVEHESREVSTCFGDFYRALLEVVRDDRELFLWKQRSLKIQRLMRVMVLLFVNCETGEYREWACQISRLVGGLSDPEFPR